MSAWWKSWGPFVVRTIGHAGSVASVVGILAWVLPRSKPTPTWFVVLLIVVGAIVFAFAVADFRVMQRRVIKAASDEKGIRNYMHNWIRHGGRVAIWTRDMSWARNDETKSLLEEKARNDELVICLPSLDDLTSHLRSLGAEVVDYGSCGYKDPKVRFTIRYFERTGTEVAVGYADGAFHVIDELSSKDDPTFYLAQELVALIRKQKTMGII